MTADFLWTPTPFPLSTTAELIFRRLYHTLNVFRCFAILYYFVTPWTIDFTVSQEIYFVQYRLLRLL